jgi:thiaminase/transcriptional activator TenA
MTTSSKDFWDAAASMIAVTEKHPFLVTMVDGTLAEDNFKYYVIQDALYLTEFADCLRRLAKSADSKEDSERLDNFAKGAEEAEMSLHNSFFVQWNISNDGAEEMPNCLLYTSYMKRIVATKSHAEGLAALLPCFWVYMHVGKCMLKLRDELGDRYVRSIGIVDFVRICICLAFPFLSVKRPPAFDAWIDMYGGDDFEKEVKDYIAMVDAACKTASDSELLAMKKHFLMSCKLEHMFWDQATNMMKWPEIGGM